jgi:hypothetical protein
VTCRSYEEYVNADSSTQLDFLTGCHFYTFKNQLTLIEETVSFEKKIPPGTSKISGNLKMKLFYQRQQARHLYS